MIGGRYSLDREIGRGGMGSVWLGRDEVLGRVVALKRIGSQAGMSSPDLLRAEREARIAARINHPHVVAVFDLVDDDDVQWLVMEYVEGQTLSELIRAQGRLSPEETARLVAQAADALAAAHEAGVTHRDVKPSNILVAHDGTVKLSDFGIARAEQDPSLTATGLVTGSPAYISPEVASGRPASSASDVWSLGATAFHALSGRPPYDVADNILGALYRIVHEEPPRLEDGGWPAEFVTAAMDHDPDARWTMAEVAAFLHAGPGAEAPRRSSPTAPTAVAPAAPVPAASDATQRLTATPLSTPAVPEPAPAPAAAPASGPGHAARSGRRLFPVLVGLAAAALLLVVGFLVLGGGDDPATDAASGPADTPSASPEASDEPSKPAAPTAEEMEGFVADYLALADSNPATAFQRLAPAYQKASDGLAGYEGFWGRVDGVELQEATADPEALTVTYTYSYELDGSSRTDEILMTLEQVENAFLIVDAVTL